MSKLQTFIEELCTYGVENKGLGTIVTILRGASQRQIRNFITGDEIGMLLKITFYRSVFINSVKLTYS